MHKKSYKSKAYKRYPSVIEKKYLEFYNYNWNKIFNDSRELVVELGSAKAEFLINLAIRNPGRNFIGVELRSPRIWFGAKNSFLLQVPNIRFLQANVFDLEEYFLPDSLSEIWLTFPEPHPKKSRAKNRFTHSRFLKVYEKLLKPGGKVFLKTDNKKLYEFSLEEITNYPTAKILAQTDDLYNSEVRNKDNEILTGYERTFLGKGEKTHYIEFIFE